MTNPESDRPLEPGTIIANNYRVAARLGAGGMGTVYLAENVTLSQRVVVKVLSGGQRGAGQEEAQMLANLQHPNVVTVYAHDPALDCIVMEFLDGSSLSTLLEKGIDRVNAIRVALAVAEALAAVHKRGLVHRDIKPENVMLALNSGGGGGRLVDWLKLIDFGLALKVGKTPPVLLGTPEFCGPEQFIASEVAHPANDVYALGVTIFLMLTGEFPFDGPREELPALHFHQPPPGLVDTLVKRFGRGSFDPRTLALLEDLDELLQQMLAKAMPDRPSAQEVARRLTRLESSFAEAGTYVGSAAPPIALSEQSASRRRRSGTSVLTRAHKADSSSATTPDVQPVTTMSARAMPAAPPASDSAPELAPQKSNRGLIIALALLVLALAVAVGALGTSPPTPVEPEVAPATPRDASSPIAKAEPVGTVPPTPTPTPAPAPIDAGAAVVVVPDAGGVVAEPEELSALAPIKKARPVLPKTPKAASCRYDDAFASSARKTLAQLQRGASRVKRDELEELGDELHDAFRTKDCRAVEAVLKKMRAVASSK
ncbi:MAG: serine/threonine-protein kinase [Archangium sp.]|nr:serine/threonine-protein kinase [Archangium sp.]